MKCKSCGADYKLRDSECPYCGRENKLGKYWSWQERKAEKDYKDTKKEVITSGTLYVANKIVNGILGVIIAIQILLIGVIFIISYIGDDVEMLTKGKESTEQIQSLYEAGDYNTLYEYMSEHDVLHEDAYYVYAQAAFMYMCWENFEEQRMVFYEAELEDIEYRPQYGLVDYCMRYAAEIYQKDWSINHQELAPENQAYYDKLCSEADAFLIGELGMTYKEAMSLREIRSFEDEWDVLKHSIFERNGWQWREDNE